MFTHQSHPYLIQLAALWCSFVPAFAIVALVTAEQLENLRRRVHR
jgi:hypothetical protein